MTRNKAQKGSGGRSFVASPAGGEDDRSTARLFWYSDGSRTVTVELGIVNDRWLPVGFDVRAHRGSQGRALPLTAREIRSLPFGALVDASLVSLRREDEATLASEGAVVRTDARGRHRVSIRAAGAQRGIERTKAPKPGRPPMSDEELLEDAEYWLDASSWMRKPTQMLAEMRGMSRSGAAKRVQEARRRGLLPPSS